MKYSGSLVKKEREKIFSMFLREQKLRFADIEKNLKIRSNMVSYHLSQLVEEKVLRKKNEFYELTEEGEKYLPIFSHVTGREVGPVPVILVAVMRKNKLCLIKRNKRPYKDYLSMAGGKIKINESLDEASIRIAEEKTGLKTRFVSINAVLHEKVHGDDVKHSFILFFAKVEVENSDNKNKISNRKQEKISSDLMNKKVYWFTEKNFSKEDIIPSDLWLMKNKLHSKISVFSADMDDEEGKMKNFKVRKIAK